ncbi:MAG TPA: tetratricopeptide repeat protein [Ktedonobacterales bacterium]|nr:tetratricopeptide repeat protein [Ktedonobacterales bacterium]
MTQATYQPEEKARLTRELTERAIRLALESNWEEAADANQRLLSAVPRDLSALNRLGKALSELGRYGAAKDAYRQALEIDPTNNIARKNLERLSHLGEAPQTAPTAHERIDPRLFIEETGKTGFTDLVDVAGRDVLARLTAGDQVYLDREDNLLYVRNGAGVRIGRVEARLANRLIKFMDSGNQYAAGISELNERQVRIIIRETFQHPSMFGKVSFSSQQVAPGDMVRGYIKDTMLRRDLDDEDELNEEGEYTDSDDDDSDDDAHEPDFEEAGFTESEE